jgi:hypothetical protein
MVAAPNPGIAAARVQVAEPSEAVVQIGDPEARSKYDVAVDELTVMATFAPLVEAEIYFGRRFALADERAGSLSTRVTVALDDDPAGAWPDFAIGSDEFDAPPLHAASDSDAAQIIIAAANMIGRVCIMAFFDLG